MIASIGTSAHSPSKIRNARFLFLLAALIAASASAQTQLGTLFGTVTDASGAVVPGAEVSVENVTTGLKRMEHRQNGRISAGGLADRKVYASRSERRIPDRGSRRDCPEPGAAIGINLSLVVGKLSVHATVEAGVPSVDTTTTTVEGMMRNAA